MSVIRSQDAVELKLPGRTVRFYATPQSSSIDNLMSCTTEIPVGNELPYHRHVSENELMFFIRGQGEAVLDGHTETVSPGDLFCAPKGCLHTIKNTGTEPLFFCCAFAPPLDITPYLEKAKQYASEEE